jgi:outer membrane protein assembly factor BamE (lipoprotein component of BamABCDE complex)
MYRSISRVALAAGLALAAAGCSTLARLEANAPPDADHLAQIHAGLTQDEVRNLAGRPGNVTSDARAGGSMWIYSYRDDEGFSSELDVDFSPNGVVTSTYSERNDY